MNDTTENQPAVAKKPSHIASLVREREGEKSIWTRIGAAWPHADGKGFTVQIEAVPLDGRIVLRIPSETKE